MLTEVALLVGIAGMLLAKAYGGELIYYVHPRYSSVVIASAVVLLLVAVARSRRLLTDRASPRGGGRRTGGYLVMALPLLVALLAPARSLGAATLGDGEIQAGLGGTVSLSAPSGEQALQVSDQPPSPQATNPAARRVGVRRVATPRTKPTISPSAAPNANARSSAKAPRKNSTSKAEGSLLAKGKGAPPSTRSWDLLQWGMVLEQRKLQTNGWPVVVDGLVYLQDGQPREVSFYAARQVMVHCVADLRPVGLPVVWKGGATPKSAWVRVSGRISWRTIDGQTVPVIVASKVSRIKEPKSPYLYYQTFG